jgi:hypothetical protein
MRPMLEELRRKLQKLGELLFITCRIFPPRPDAWVNLVILPSNFSQRVVDG